MDSLLRTRFLALARAPRLPVREETWPRIPPTTSARQNLVVQHPGLKVGMAIGNGLSEFGSCPQTALQETPTAARAAASVQSVRLSPAGAAPRCPQRAPTTPGGNARGGRDCFRGSGCAGAGPRLRGSQ